MYVYNFCQSNECFESFERVNTTLTGRENKGLLLMNYNYKSARCL